MLPITARIPRYVIENEEEGDVDYKQINDQNITHREWHIPNITDYQLTEWRK